MIEDDQKLISNLKKTEAELLLAKKEAEQAKMALESIIANMPEHVYWKDINGVYLGCNDRQAQTLGLSYGSEVLGKADSDLPWGEEIASKFRENDIHILKTGESQVFEEPMVLNNKKINLLSYKTPLKDLAGNIAGVLGISIDITERKKAEIELQIAKEKAEQIRQAVMILAGSIAHDLQSPLLSLELTLSFFQGKLAAEMMSDVVQDSIQKMGDQINKTIGDMKVFINETLKTLNQTVKGTSLKSDFKSYHVNMLVTHVLDDYPFISDERKRVHWDNDCPFEFLGNAVYFYRILFNLIKNALFQIQQKGRGEIFISSDTDGDTHLLRFKDTAGGVKAETVQSLFQAYETTKKEGTGVGLAFCQLTMQSFGGKMTCHLVEGDCIEFVLSFPKIKPMSKESLAEEIEAVMKK